MAGWKVVAPMVGASDLAFRLLCRKYGADLCFTEMFHSARFVADEDYRNKLFMNEQRLPMSPEHEQLYRPLVVQFGGNDPEVLLAAVRTPSRAPRVLLLLTLLPTLPRRRPNWWCRTATPLTSTSAVRKNTPRTTSTARSCWTGSTGRW
jgi:tRNA-dihydrouridine synthase 1